MWLASRPTGCSAAESSRAFRRRPARASSSSVCRVTRTARTLRGPGAVSSLQRPACSDRASTRRSRHSSRKGSFRCSLQGAKAAGTRRSIWSDQTANYGLPSRPYLRRCYGSLRMPNTGHGYGLPSEPEVEISHVRGSSELQSRRVHPSRSGRLAGRCPSGEEAQSDLTSGARQQPAGADPAWPRLLRLMTSRWQDALSRQSADGTVEALEVAGTRREFSTRGRCS